MARDRDVLAPYQPSQRYILLDQARMTDADLPVHNLVSALIGLGKERNAERLYDALRKLRDLLMDQDDGELTRVFVAWITHVVPLLGRRPDSSLPPLEQLKETYTMLEDTVQGWVEQGRVQGIEQGRAEGIERGIEQGRSDERALLCRQAARKFDDETADRLAAALAGVVDPDRLARVGDWIIECSTANDLIARVVGDRPPRD